MKTIAELRRERDERQDTITTVVLRSDTDADGHIRCSASGRVHTLSATSLSSYTEEL